MCVHRSTGAPYVCTYNTFSTDEKLIFEKNIIQFLGLLSKKLAYLKNSPLKESTQSTTSIVLLTTSVRYVRYHHTVLLVINHFPVNIWCLPNIFRSMNRTYNCTQHHYSIIYIFLRYRYIPIVVNFFSSTLKSWVRILLS